jgi:GTPase SAR1 family protein
MSNYKITQKIADVQHIKQAIHSVFGDHPDASEWIGLCEAALNNLNDIRDNRGLEETVIAVVGHKNAGKSFFCQSFLTDDKDMKKIKTGNTVRYSTTKLLWLGSSQPKRLNEEYEEYLNIEKSNFVAFKQPYVLVDVPGFNDVNPDAQKIAKKVISIASVIVLVVKWDNGFELESEFNYLSLGNGLTIVPLIVDHQFDNRDTLEVRQQLEEFENKLKRQFGNDRVLAPVCVPQWSTYDQVQQNLYKNKAIEINQTVIKSALKAKQVERSFMADNLYARFLHELDQQMYAAIGSILPSYDALKQKEAETVTQITSRLTGSDDAYIAGIRMRMMSRIVEKTSRIFIPFRSMMGLLSITSGAWDKLTLSFAGSLPSLAMVLFQSGKNVKNIHDQKARIRHDLAEQLEDLYQKNLGSVQQDFIAALNTYNKRVINKEAVNWQDLKTTDQSLMILENIADEQINNHVEKSVGKANDVNVFGFLATLVFIFLLLGPLSSIYVQFVTTGFISITNLGSVWQDFPAPSFSMISSSLLLSVIPVFILSIIAMSIAVRTAKVNKCARDSKNNITLKFSSFIEESIERFYQSSLEKRKNFEFLHQLFGKNNQGTESGN